MQPTPISLLTSFSKVFKKIIYNGLLKYIETDNILVNEQFGFRISSSTDKASYKLIDEILNAVNKKMYFMFMVPCIIIYSIK